MQRCRQCTRELRDQSHQRRYCSQACRQQAYRRRRNAAVVTRLKARSAGRASHEPEPITEYTMLYLAQAGVILLVAADESDRFLALMGRRAARS